MSKRGSTFQGSKEDPDLNRDGGPQDTARKADANTMSGRKTLVPRSRRRGGAGGADLSSLPNPFANVDPNIANGQPSPAANNSNPFNNASFGQNAQSQSFPVPSFGSNNQNVAPQNSSFPPSQNSNSNLFGAMNGGSSAFTFGGSNTNSSNPFAQVTQQNQQAQAPASTPKFNLFGSAQQQPQSLSQPQPPAPTPNLFGQTQNQPQQHTSGFFGQPSTPPIASNNSQSHNTSPNDMDMASPPQANKHSNPLRSFGQQSAGTSVTAPPSNMFGSLNAPVTSGSSSFTQPTPSLFAVSNDKPANNPFASSGLPIFNNLNQPSSNPTSTESQGSGLFGKTQETAGSNTPSNLFGGFAAPKSGATATTASQPSSTNLFQTVGSAQNAPVNQTAAPPVSAGFFPSTPQPSSSTTAESPGPLFGRIAPQTAPPKTSSEVQNTTNTFGDALARSQEMQKANSAGASSTPSLFGTKPQIASPAKPAEPVSRNLFGGVGSDAAVQPRLPANATAEMLQHFQRIDRSTLHLLTALDASADWSDLLTRLAEDYKTSVSRIGGASRTGAPAPAFGTKRKEQADPPAEPSRPAKQANTTPAPQESSLQKEQSASSKKFESLFNSSKTQQGSTPPPQPQRLFGQTDGSSNVFTNTVPQNATSNTSKPNGMFSQPASTANIFGSTNGQQSNNFGSPDENNDGNRFNSPKASSANIFGHVSNAHEIHEDDEGEDEEGTFEDVLRNKPASTEKGLFDRISGGPPPKNDSPEPEASEDGLAANGAEDEPHSLSETHSSAGDHTWKTNDPIHFGDSANSQSTPKVNGSTNNIFGMPSAAQNPFNVSSTPAGLPAKAAENNLFGSKQPGSSFVFKPSENNLFVPKQPTTNQSSRATTPGTDINGVSASEAEGESSAQETEITNGEVMADKTSLTTEELSKEEILYEVPKLKILQYLPVLGQEEEKEWRARGTGPFRVLKNKSTEEVRILHRIAPSGKVLINSRLLKGATFKKLANKGSLSIGAVGATEGKEKTMTFQNYMARMASDETAKELVRVLENNKESN